MRPFAISVVVPILSLAPIVQGFNTNDQVGADVDYGSFANPSNYVRPRFRYWAPDASVDHDVVSSDIVDAASRGVGGVEFLGYYLYGGGEAGDIPVDWSLYGWGTPAWKSLFDSALQTTKDNGLLLDFPLGPNQGAGVPAPADSDGLLWELLPYNVSIPVGGTFDDTLPGWGSGQLVTASIGLALETVETTLISNENFAPTAVPGNQTTLAASSLRDVTANVTSDGHLTYQFPPSDTGVAYHVFAYYQVHSPYREAPSPEDPGFPAVPQSPVTSFVQNGSWVVDHFSAKGAQVVTGFWEQYLLPNGTKELLQEVGNYGWEDSQEFGAGVTVWWTPSLLQRFAAARAYDLSSYMPTIFYLNNGVDGALPTRNHFVTDEPDQGMSHIEDYRQTLTELNQDYIKALSDWCQQSVQSQFSAQVGYNLQMDMLAQIPYVNAPETESLDFNHNVDAFRQYSGPASLANKRVISSELGAERQEAYQETIQQIIWNVQRSIAGGINHFVFHGLVYSGEYPGCTWPGFTTFAFRFSEMHGSHQPGWDYYSDFLNWTARSQWVAQTGVPRFDLAFWLKNENWTSVVSKYTPSDLNDEGFTYQYLSPDNLNLPLATVVDGQLAPDSQAFKALVVRANDSLTVDGVNHLVQYAQAGLPIVFSGGVPSDVFGSNASASQYVNDSLASIQGLSNVHPVDYDGLAQSLLQLGISPRAAPNVAGSTANNTVWTNWRYDQSSNMSYVTIYNDATGLQPSQGAIIGNVTLEATGSPSTYNAWNGVISPIFVFAQNATHTTLPISLAGNQSTIIAFDGSSAPHSHFTSGPGNILSVSPGADTDTSAVVVSALPAPDGSKDASLISSNGTSYSLSAPTANPVSLTKWTLAIESWAPPQNISDINSVRTNTTYNIDSLVPWTEIDSPKNDNVSGRGYYGNTFDVPAEFGLGDGSGGAALSLPPYAHTLRASVNGMALPVLDINNPIADITSYLNEAGNDGSSKGNTIDVVVSTPLGNAARAVWGELMCGGLGAQGNLPPVTAYGLVGQASVQPLSLTKISL